MKKLLHAVLFLLGGLTLILSTSVAPAHADSLLPIPGPEHDHSSAINSNSTDQSAHADATTKQANFNVPISVLSFGSNNGDVKQSNNAGTEANAENGNATYQRAAGQPAIPWYGGQDGQQASSNSNRTDQHAGADAYTKQVNVNAPISVLSYGSNNGNVDQSNRGYTDANAENYNSTKQAQSGSQDGQWNGKDSRHDNATNSNRTDQHAGADAYTKQVNVNAPISVLSYGSNNGNVDQSNKAYTNANAENYNSTKQQAGEQHPSPKHDDGNQCGHDQNGYGPKGHDQAESGTNRNDTHQRSYADAYTQQKNVNAPVSFLSFGSNNGNVDQSNKAYTNAGAENLNSTFQKADGQGHDMQPTQYGRDGIDGSKDGGHDFQSPSNDNHTDQHAYANATTKQKNVNFPVSFLSFGSNNGNVHQHNSAGTQAFAGNGNWTGQWAGPVFGNA